MPRGGKRVRITNEEKDNIRRMLKSGMTTAQISDETGRSWDSVNNIRKELKLEGFDIWHRPGAMSQFTPVANTGSMKKEEVIEEDIPDEIEVPDIPEIPSVSASEPVMEPEKPAEHSDSAIEVVKKMAKFSGRKTGFGYIATSENDYLTIRDDGTEFKIDTNKLEAFVDELIDITEEVKKFKNSL